MFGDVARFAEADYFAAHPAGSISLPDAAYTIELFACVVTDAYDTFGAGWKELPSPNEVQPE